MLNFIKNTVVDIASFTFIIFSISGILAIILFSYSMYFIPA